MKTQRHLNTEVKSNRKSKFDRMKFFLVYLRIYKLIFIQNYANNAIHLQQQPEKKTPS